MARLDFDSDGYDPAKDFELLEPGWYAAQIVASEVKETKSGNGSFLQIELELVESHHPDLGKRKLWDRLNIWNPNTKAVEIANRTLSAICRATGKPVVEDSEELHHIPMAVKIKVRPEQGEYGPQNEIRQYDPLGEHFGQRGVPKPPAADRATRATTTVEPDAGVEKTSVPPWKRGASA